MRRLLAYTCLTPVVFVMAVGSAQAETSITAKTTNPVATSTIKSGAADDIKITSAGSVVPTSGVAVTIDSANSVKNEGTIQITDASNSAGIRAHAGTAGTITNLGKIIIDEKYEPVDSDKDGDLDGPFAQGSNRYGIHLAPGGSFTGAILNAGEITIEGNQSAGIAADSRLVGTLTNSGSISVIGDNSVGIRANDVTGKVEIRGAVGARGANAVGVALDGDVGGLVQIQGAISSSGYRSTTPPADPSKLDADDLLQGGPALRIAGNVAGGILLDIPPPNKDDKDKDEDKDGIDDDKEGSAVVTSYGAAPAVQIGSADRAIAIGAVAGDASGHGFIVKGNVSGFGVYSGVNATAIAIGGLGQDVTIAGGMTVTGSVRAESNGASATAIRIGDGATVNEIRIGGSVLAGGGKSATSLTHAVLIDQQAHVATIRNSGTIGATTSGDGTAGAIVDRSGGVTLVENSGKISASGAPAARAIAIDLSANSSGAVVRQTKVEQGAATPTITGSILFGAGDDLLDLTAGSVTGTTRFGEGTNRLTMSGSSGYSGTVVFGAGNDRLTLAGTSTFSGTADFGGGSDILDISGTARFGGTLANSAQLAVQINGGSLDLANGGTVALASLSVAGKGGIGVNIDAAAGTNTLYDVAGAATFAADSEVYAKLANISQSEGSYTFLRAGSLAGTDGLSFNAATLPFLFKGSIETDAARNEVALVIARKTASELGLNRSEASAYDSIFAVLDEDAALANVFLGLASADAFQGSIRQMLPDHAGGAFDTVTQGSRATSRFLADPRAPLAVQGGWGFWLQQVAWGSSKNLGDTAAYDITGWGAAGGAEIITDAGNFGLSLAYLTGSDADGETDNEVKADQFEFGAYWRGQWGGLRGYARASAATIDFDGSRHFNGVSNGQAIRKTANGSWSGRLVSAMAGVSYELGAGGFTLRPAASVDYYRLKEKGYTETGGGDAFDLVVDGRISDELAGTATLTAGLNFGKMATDSGWLRAEIEGGRRQILAGALGSTTARFGTGDPFTLTPEERTDGWVGRIRLVGGSAGFTLGGEASAEEQQGRAAVALRVSLQIGL